MVTYKNSANQPEYLTVIPMAVTHAISDYELIQSINLSSLRLARSEENT